MSESFDEFQPAPNEWDEFQPANPGPSTRDVLKAVSSIDPAQASKASKLAKKYNAADEVLLRTLQDAEMVDRINTATTKLDKAPVLADYMRNSPFVAAQSHDDIDALTQVGQFFSDTAGSVKAGVFNASRGAAGVFRSGFEFVAPALDFLEAQTPEEFGGWRGSVGGNPLRRLAEGFDIQAQAAGATAKASAPKVDGILASGFQSGIQSLTQNALALPLAFAPGGQGAALSVMTASTGGNAYQDAREKGLSMSQALPYAASQASIEWATEKLPLLKLVGDVKAGTPVFQTLMRQVAAEVPGEQVATILQDMNEWAVLNPTKPFSSYLEERPSAAAQTLIATIVGVGGNVTVSKGIEAAITRATRTGENMQDAEANAQRLAAAMQAATASKLRARNPETFQQLVQHIAENTDGAPQSVYIDAQVLAQSGVDIATVLPGVVDQLDGALAANSFVEVPIAEALANLPGTPLEKVFLQNARSAPDALSLAEAEQAGAQATEYLKQEADRVLQQAQDQSAWQASSDTVRTTILDQLNQAGRFTPEVNEAYALLQANFFSTMAARVGITPQEMYDRFALKVTAGSQQATAGNLEQVTPEQAMQTNVPVEMPTVPEFAEAVGNTPGAQVTENGLLIDLVRFQKPEQEGAQAIRTGVFYLPAKSPNVKYYKPSKAVPAHYGGTEKMEGQTLIRRPLFVKGATGGKAPEAAYDAVKGKGAMKTLDKAVMDVVTSRGFMTKIDPESFLMKVEQFLGDFGGDRGLAGEIIRNSTQGNQLRYALQEHVIASTVRAAGYDAVVGYSKGKAGANISEVFDVREQTFPARGMESQIADEFLNQSATSLPPTIEIDGKQRPTTNSNGQPIAATEEGVRNFWAWFGDSKVVDAEGRPLVLYHGTTADVEQFDVDFSGADGVGYNVPAIFATTDKALASDYALNKFDREIADAIREMQRFKNTNPGVYNDDYERRFRAVKDAFAKQRADGRPELGGGANVVPLYMRGDMGEVDAKGQRFMAVMPKALPEFMAQGKDGVIVNDVIDNASPATDYPARVFVTFAPENVKSATGNDGTFDPANPNILRQQARGTFNPQSLLITLNENADLSTFLHESGHFFLEVMADLASQPGAPAQVREDMDKLLAWFGIKGDETVGGADSGVPLAQAAVSEKVQKAEQIIAGIDPEEQAVLYHSGDASIDAQLAEGIEPTFGPWLEEVLAGAVDDADLASDIREQDPVAFYAEEPTWVAMKVAKVLRKPVREVTVDDIRQHGQLSIVVVDQDDSSIWREPGDGTAEQFTGKARRSYTMSEVPFGVERGDVFTTDAFVPEITLTGDDLIQFLQRNAPGKNNLPKTQALAQDGNLPVDNTQPAGRTPLETWNAMTLDQKRPYHERFAESFEQYLLEGKAPSAELQPLFRRFRSWLVNVYKSLKEFMRGRDLNMNDEVRQVFDRMLATDEQIAQAEETAGMLPDFDATNEAIEKLQARSLRDLKWTVGARSRALKALQKEAANLRKAVEAEVRAEVDDMPVYQAQAAIDRIKGEPSTEQLETIAEATGFTSASEMLTAIGKADAKAAMIEGMTDQRMLENFGELATPQAIEEAANDAVHNEARARALATELKGQADALNPRQQTGTDRNGRPVTVNALVAAAKQFAENITARRKVKDLKKAAAQHRAAEARAGKAWQEATAKGKTQEAVQAKRDQMLNNYAAKSMQEADAEITKVIDYFKKFDKDTIRKNIPSSYLDQIDALLENMDLRKSVSRTELERRASLRKWVESQQAIGLDPIVPDELMENAQRVSYKEMTVDELRSMRDVIKNIEHLGRLKSKLLAAKDKREFDAAVDAWAKEIRDNGGKPLPVKLEGDSRPVKMFKSAWADHRKLNSLIRQFAANADNSEGFKLLIRSMNERGTQEDVMIEEASVRLAEIHAPIEKLPGGFSGAKLFIPEINNSLTRAGRLAVALNWGNEQNRQRVRDGDNWTNEQVDAILRTLTPVELKFVNDVWEYLDSYWPEIKAKQERVSGVVEDKVQADPFTVTLADGTEVQMRGGYYPIKYDGDRSLKSQKQEAEQIAKDMLRGAMLRPATRRGHTKARVDEVIGRPVKKDLSVITQHVTQVVHDLAWHEWAIDANRLMNDPRIASAIRDYYGAETHRAMTDAIEAIVVGDVAKQTSIDQLLLMMRANVTRSIMGASLTTALLQPFGLTQSMARIGVTPVLKGAGRWAGDALRMESTVKWVGEKSDFMRLRSKTFNRELREISQRVRGKSKIAQVADASLFMLMQKMQLVADIPTWVGAYEKALNSGAEEATAVQLADEAVLSSQGGGNTRDLAAVQRDHPFLTQFYSYFNTTLQLVTESTAATDFKNPRAVAGWLGDMMLLAVVPAILPALITFSLKGGGEDDEPEEWAKRLVEWQAGYMLGMFVGLRELPALWSPFDYGGPPAAKLINDGRRLVQQANQGEIDEPAVLATIGFLGTALGIPTTQIVRSYKGWKAWDEGDAPASSILFGPPPKD